jgi:hypothetical protein
MVSRVEITNEEVEAREALTSRYYRVTIPYCPIPSSEFNTKMSESISKDNQTYLQIEHYLSALVYKAWQTGLVPEPDMQLFVDLSNRARQYLLHQKAISHDVGQRQMEIMIPFAIQCVIRHAIHCYFDLIGVSPMYKKPFLDASQIKGIGRFLYSTEAIFRWVWTALGSNWVEDKHGKGLKALFSGMNIPYNFSISPYENAESDLKERITFKQTDGMIDLNYVFIKGSLATILLRAQSQGSGLSTGDLKGILNELAKKTLPVPGGPYEPVPKKDFDHWHRFTKLPSALDDTGIKNTTDALGMVPDIFRQSNPDTNIPRCEEDMPRQSIGTALPVIEIAEEGVYILTAVIDKFSTSVIEEAIQYATTCSSSPPGKFLTGFPSDKNAAQLQVYEQNQEDIDEYVQLMDMSCGYDEHGNWTGDPNLEEELRPVSRRQGIGFNRRGNIDEMDQVFFTTAPGCPIREDQEAEWSRKMIEEAKSMNKMREVWKDLDYESAFRQHIASGQALDDEILDPKTILKKSIEAGLICKNLNYPDAWQGIMKYQETVWEHQISSKQINVTSEFMKRQREKRARAEEQAAQVSHRRPQQGGPPMMQRRRY